MDGCILYHRHCDIYITTFLMYNYKIFDNRGNNDFEQVTAARQLSELSKVTQNSNQEDRTSTVRLHCIRCSKPNRFKFYSRFIQTTLTIQLWLSGSTGAWNFMDHFRTELYAVFAQTGSRV
jgi:hypothetical protein